MNYDGEAPPPSMQYTETKTESERHTTVFVAFGSSVLELCQIAVLAS